MTERLAHRAVGIKPRALGPASSGTLFVARLLAAGLAPKAAFTARVSEGLGLAVPWLRLSKGGRRAAARGVGAGRSCF